MKNNKKAVILIYILSVAEEIFWTKIIIVMYSASDLVVKRHNILTANTCDI